MKHKRPSPNLLRHKLAALRMRFFPCQQFFDRDASLEIDRLTVEVESLREQFREAR